jgi:hypothetical protein
MGDNHITGIELSDAVEAVRDGLVTAANRATAQDLRFELGEIQMEFTVELRRDTRGKGGVKAWVVDAGAEAGRSSGRTQKVAFALKPVNAQTGDSWRISNDDRTDDLDLSGFGGPDGS